METTTLGKALQKLIIDGNDSEKIVVTDKHENTWSPADLLLDLDSEEQGVEVNLIFAGEKGQHGRISLAGGTHEHIYYIDAPEGVDTTIILTTMELEILKGLVKAGDRSKTVDIDVWDSNPLVQEFEKELAEEDLGDNDYDVKMKEFQEGFQSSISALFEKIGLERT